MNDKEKQHLISGRKNYKKNRQCKEVEREDFVDNNGHI